MVKLAGSKVMKITWLKKEEVMLGVKPATYGKVERIYKYRHTDQVNIEYKISTC